MNRTISTTSETEQDPKWHARMMRLSGAMLARRVDARMDELAGLDADAGIRLRRSYNVSWPQTQALVVEPKPVGRLDKVEMTCLLWDIERAIEANHAAWNARNVAKVPQGSTAAELGAFMDALVAAPICQACGLLDCAHLTASSATITVVDGGGAGRCDTCGGQLAYSYRVTRSDDTRGTLCSTCLGAEKDAEQTTAETKCNAGDSINLACVLPAIPTHDEHRTADGQYFYPADRAAERLEGDRAMRLVLAHEACCDGDGDALVACQMTAALVERCERLGHAHAVGHPYPDTEVPAQAMRCYAENFVGQRVVVTDTEDVEDEWGGEVVGVMWRGDGFAVRLDDGLERPVRATFNRVRLVATR